MPGTQRTVTDTGATTARTCTTEVVADPAGACVVDETLFGATPHFPVDFFGITGAPVREAVEVRWRRASGSARVALSRSVDVDDRDDLALRVVVPPRSGTVRFAVRLRDRDGGVARLGEVSLKGLPGGRQDTDPDTFDPMPGKYWAQELRVPLDQAKAAKAGLDLAHVTGIDLVPVSARGRLWLLDAWARDPGLARDRRVPFVRVDVGTLDGYRAAINLLGAPAETADAA